MSLYNFSKILHQIPRQKLEITLWPTTTVAFLFAKLHFGCKMYHAVIRLIQFSETY